MKNILPLLLVLLLSACDNSDVGVDDAKLKYVDENASGTPNAELIGKTVDQYQDIVKNEEKPVGEQQAGQSHEGSAVPLDLPEVEAGFKPIMWEGLIAPGYDAEAILKKYDPIVSTLAEGSEEANELYRKMQAEYDQAPANTSLANTKVSIPGFIAPLEQKDGIISEFLLVPYFGACIHSPAPPANQTVHVKVASKFGISVNDAYDPIWVSGELQIDKTNTDIGNAGYKVDGAKIQKYEVEN